MRFRCVKRGRTMLKLPLYIALSCAAGMQLNAAEKLRSTDFTPAEKCGSCHEEIYQQWRTTAHAQAATDSVFWTFYQQALRDTGGSVAASCVTCHAPVATVTKELRVTGPVSLPVPLSAIAKEGVTCDFCHTISGNE